MKRTILALFLIGCASPSEYRQGAARPPAPPRFNPTTDAPHTVGHPGHLAPREYPRSPYTRALPPTREPGIWAAYSPWDGAPARPLLLGVDLPYPEGEDPELDMETASVCSSTMSEIAVRRDASPFPGLEKWKEPLRRCMAARLYAHCAETWLEFYRKRARAADFVDRAYEERIKASLAVALRFREEACKGVAAPPEAEALFLGVSELWDRHLALQLQKRGLK